MHQFLLDWIDNRACPIEEFTIFLYEINDIRHKFPDDEIYFLVELQQTANRKMRTFGGHSWRQSSTPTIKGNIIEKNSSIKETIVW